MKNPDRMSGFFLYTWLWSDWPFIENLNPNDQKLHEMQISNSIITPMQKWGIKGIILRIIPAILNKIIKWNDQDKQAFFDAMYRDALLLQWQKGDVAIVDNIKIAHWRMNGEQGNRKLIQIQANAFNADKHYAAWFQAIMNIHYSQSPTWGFSIV